MTKERFSKERFFVKKPLIFNFNVHLHFSPIKSEFVIFFLFVIYFQKDCR